MAGSAERPRQHFNAVDQEIPDDRSYAAIVKSVVEIVQRAEFLGPVESNNGFTILGVPIGGGSGDAHVIEDEGTPLTARAKLNFVGTGVAVTDDSGDNASVVTVTAYVHPNHSGDVTSVADGETTIAADAVSNTKLANMAEALIKGRAAAAGTGDPQDLTATQVRTIINVEDGANDYTHPNHSGDVTSVGDGATTIANDAVTTVKILNSNVTNAKMADMATKTLKGRNTGSTGAPEDVTTLQLRTFTWRTGTTTSSATPSIDSDLYDYYSITALAEAITGITVTGTPTEGQRLWISITGTATRAITLGSGFEASTVPLPTTTDGTNRLDIGCVWNSVTSKWRVVCVA